MVTDNQIKVSIVVPVYNVEAYIDTCLKSLVDQTLEDIEIVVVNDGSPDHSQAIIDAYVSRYPGKVRSFIKENEGLSEARNYGMRQCRGEYIGFVDSDDYVEVTMYEHLYRKAKETDADLVDCDYIKEYEDISVPVRSTEHRSNREMLLGGLAAAWNKIYKRETLERARVTFPKGLIYEDTAFFCNLIPYLKTCSYVPGGYVHYIQRQGSIANTQGKKVAVIFDIVEKILLWYREKGFWNDYKEELTYFISRVLLGSSMERISRMENREERRALGLRTLGFLDEKLPGWRKNSYLKGKSLRHMYMKALQRWNLPMVMELLRLGFKKNDRRLMKGTTK